MFWSLLVPLRDTFQPHANFCFMLWVSPSPNLDPNLYPSAMWTQRPRFSATHRKKFSVKNCLCSPVLLPVFPAPPAVLLLFSFPTLALTLYLGHCFIFTPYHKSLSRSSCTSRFCLYHVSWDEIKVTCVFIAGWRKKPRSVTQMGLGSGCQSKY